MLSSVSPYLFLVFGGGGNQFSSSLEEAWLRSEIYAYGDGSFTLLKKRVKQTIPLFHHNCLTLDPSKPQSLILAEKRNGKFSRPRRSRLIIFLPK